jgi:anti-anti-sigma factor
VQPVLSQSLCWCLETEQIEHVTVCRFPGHELYLDEAAGQSIFDELDHLVREGRHQLILDFANVAYFSGAIRNMLILLHHRLRALGGWLIICRLNANIREVFEVTRLTTFLDIRSTEPEELALAC